MLVSCRVVFYSPCISAASLANLFMWSIWFEYESGSIIFVLAFFSFFLSLVLFFLADAESSEFMNGNSNVFGMFNTGGSVWIAIVTDVFVSGFTLVGRVWVSLVNVFGFR